MSRGLGVGAGSGTTREEQEDLAHIPEEERPTRKPGVERGGRTNAPFTQNN